jgi:hypothetical protein
MCTTDSEGSKSDCGSCECKQSTATHSPVDSTVTYPNGQTLSVRKCSGVRQGLLTPLDPRTHVFP